ncbi:MAG: malonyl-CoA synthase [Henriciella sp.]
MNVYEALTGHFQQSPERVFLTTTAHEQYTQGDIEADTARLANLLVQLGAKPGDRISVQVEKSVVNWCLYLACLRAGLVYHPLNPAYGQGELSYFLSNAEPFAIICDPNKLALMKPLAEDASIAHVLTLDGHGHGSLIEGADGQPGTFQTVQRKENDTAALLYSSGTTGKPKGIMLSHKNLQTNALALAEAWAMNADDCLFHSLPIFHVHGLFIALGSLMVGGGQVLWAPKFTAQVAKENLPNCTVMMGVPTYYTRLLADPEFGRAHTANMRLFISGSAPLLPETFESFEARTGHTILERYGMTETVITCSNPYSGPRKAGTVGRPLPGIEARIVSTDGKPVKTNEVGELEVRGESVFTGYWRMPEQTAKDIGEDGFFRTGDQATLDDDGYVSIVGRSKDMVISGGLNIYPKEVEEVLDLHPSVLETAIIGVPHPDFGEAVVAVVVANGKQPKAEEIISLAKAELANFKVPKHVHFIEELPRNTMGKVQKKQLRDALSDLF